MKEMRSRNLPTENLESLSERGPQPILAIQFPSRRKTDPSPKSFSGKWSKRISGENGYLRSSHKRSNLCGVLRASGGRRHFRYFQRSPRPKGLRPSVFLMAASLKASIPPMI